MFWEIVIASVVGSFTVGAVFFAKFWYSHQTALMKMAEKQKKEQQGVAGLMKFAEQCTPENIAAMENELKAIKEKNPTADLSAQEMKLSIGKTIAKYQPIVQAVGPMIGPKLDGLLKRLIG